MSQNKNIFLSIFMSLLVCNQVDAMKRAREGEMQDIVVVATVVQPQDYHLAGGVSLPSPSQLPAKQYWDGKSPYDGSKIIKATSDHDCKHCNLLITDESLAAHIFKHPDIYGLRPQKKLRIEVVESSDESSSSSETSDASRLSRALSGGSSSSSGDSSGSSSNSSGGSSSSSSDSSSSSGDSSSSSSESSSDSSEDEEDNKPRFVLKALKNGRIVQHAACDIGGCRFSSARPDEMNNHKRLHGADKCSVCKKCDFRTTSPVVFFNHTQRHLPKEKRSNTAQCKTCGKVLSKESSLKRHVATKHS